MNSCPSNSIHFSSPHLNHDSTLAKQNLSETSLDESNYFINEIIKYF